MLKKRIDTLADQFKTSSQTLKGLSEKSVALTKTTDLEAARIDALQDFQDEAQDANATMSVEMRHGMKCRASAHGCTRKETRV